MRTSRSPLLLLLLCVTGAFGQTDDEQAVRKLAETFNTALIERSIDRLTDAVDLPADRREAWKNSLEKGEFAQYPIKSASVRWVSVEGERASARLFWERVEAATGKDYSDYGQNHRVLYLQRKGDGWQILYPATAENDLIARILRADSFAAKQALIRGEPELNTHRIIFVILFRFQSDGQYDQAEEYYRLADWYNDEYFRDKDEFRYVNTVLNIRNSRALTEKSLGNFSGAMRLYLESAAIAEEYQKKSGRILGGTALTQVNIGSLYFQLGNLDQAEFFANAALKTLENADRRRQAIVFNSIYNLLGDIAFVRGDDTSALRFYIESRTEIPHGIAAVHLRQGRFDEAAQIYQESVNAMDRAIAGNEQIQSPRSVEALVGLSEISYRRGDSVNSLRLAKRAVEVAERTKNPELIFLALSALGNASIEAGEIAGAESAFRAAISLAEDGRRRVVGAETSQLSYLENRLGPFQKMVRIMFARGDAYGALEFAERGKSRVLNDLLRVGKIDWQSALDASEKLKQIELQDRLARLNRRQTILKYQSAPDPEQLADLSKEIERLRLEIEFLQTSAFAKYPELRRSRGLSRPSGTLEPLLAGGDRALVEFAFAGESAFIFVATAGADGKADLRVHQLDETTAKITERVNLLRTAVIEKNLGFKPSARFLYDVLFGKAASQIAGKTELVIVPDGALWSLPFAALIEPGGRFLVEKHALRLGQSLSALGELNSIRSDPELRAAEVLAVGNPKIDIAAVARVRAQYRSDLGDLPDAETEVKELRRLYGPGGLYLTKSDAREDVWKREAPRYRILHLATHGVANEYKPLYSHLFLSTSATSQGDDGLLEAWEIMNLRLNADLAVLSACETGQGRINSGEGLVGLSWAFAVANVPRVAASLWKVESGGTADLMIDFHRNLRKRPGEPPSTAMRKAMVRQAGLRKHPFYWAGFVVIGK